MRTANIFSKFSAAAIPRILAAGLAVVAYNLCAYMIHSYARRMR
jgi:hypothetical protein